MTTYLEKTIPSSPIHKLAILGCLALSFYSLLTLSVSADVTPNAHLNQAVAITLGDHQISLAAGTAVQVLQKDEEKAVISFNLQDGSPVITQISSKSLDFLPVKQASPSSGSYSAVTPQQKPAPMPNPISSQSPTQVISEQETSAKQSDVLSLSDTDINPEQFHPDFNTTLTPQDVELPSRRYTALNGYFYILIKGTAVPVVYSLPMEGRHLAKSASNLIFYGPYPNELTKLTRNIVPDVVTKLGCSVFSFYFIANNKDLNSPETAYWSKESGWFNAILDARDEIIKGFGLERKKLLLLGYSGGGGMVLNFAGAFPDEVEAVAAQGANLAPEVTQTNSVIWFIINNRGEPNAAVTQPFYKKLRTIGCNALYCETTPERGRGNYHAPSGQAFDLMYTYLAGILDQRKRIEEGTRIWPYASPVDLLKRYAIVKTSDLSEDEINGGTFDLLPSAAFALDWSEVCPPIQSITPPGEITQLRVSFPARAKPRGVVMYYDRPGCEDIGRELEDVSSLAEHGCVVISPTYNMRPDLFVQAATTWALSQDFLHGVPVHLVGYGASGADFISEMADNVKISEKSISLIDFKKSEFDQQTQTNIEMLAKECGLYGFYAYLDPKPSTAMDELANELITRGSQERGCCKLFVTPQDEVKMHSKEWHPKGYNPWEHTKEDAEEQAVEMIKRLVDRFTSS